MGDLGHFLGPLAGAPACTPAGELDRVASKGINNFGWHLFSGLQNAGGVRTSDSAGGRRRAALWVHFLSRTVTMNDHHCLVWARLPGIIHHVSHRAPGPPKLRPPRLLPCLQSTSG